MTSGRRDFFLLLLKIDSRIEKYPLWANLIRSSLTAEWRKNVYMETWSKISLWWHIRTKIIWWSSALRLTALIQMSPKTFKSSFLPKIEIFLNKTMSIFLKLSQNIWIWKTIPKLTVHLLSVAMHWFFNLLRCHAENKRHQVGEQENTFFEVAFCV